MARKKSLEEVAIETKAIEEATVDMLDVKKKVARDEELDEITRKVGIINDIARNELIAEAYRLTGRVEAFGLIQKVVTLPLLLTLKNIKENKVYKEIKRCETWEKYCKSIGFSREKIDKDLDNLDTFGEDFLVTVTTFGIGYRELRQLKKAKDSGSLAITDDSVVIDGEVINLSDKDELQDALERIITEKENTIKAQERTIKAKEELNAELSLQREDARRELEAKKDVITSILDAKNYTIPPKDKPDFIKLKALEDKITSITLDLQTLTEKDLGEVNQHLLGGVILLALKIFEEYRVILNNKEGAYLDRLFMTELELEASDKMLLPSKFKK